jgi:hypothetical protein
MAAIAASLVWLTLLASQQKKREAPIKTVLAHIPEVFTQFEKLGLTPPIGVDGIPASLKQLADKAEYFKTAPPPISEAEKKELAKKAAKEKAEQAALAKTREAEAQARADAEAKAAKLSEEERTRQIEEMARAKEAAERERDQARQKAVEAEQSEQARRTAEAADAEAAAERERERARSAAVKQEEDEKTRRVREAQASAQEAADEAARERVAARRRSSAAAHEEQARLVAEAAEDEQRCVLAAAAAALALTECCAQGPGADRARPQGRCRPGRQPRRAGAQASAGRAGRGCRARCPGGDTQQQAVSAALTLTGAGTQHALRRSEAARLAEEERKRLLAEKQREEADVQATERAERRKSIAAADQLMEIGQPAAPPRHTARALTPSRVQQSAPAALPRRTRPARLPPPSSAPPASRFPCWWSRSAVRRPASSPRRPSTACRCVSRARAARCGLALSTAVPRSQGNPGRRGGQEAAG